MSNLIYANPDIPLMDDLKAIIIHHHSGPRMLKILDEPIDHTVYRYIRQTHHFLDDHNHTVMFKRCLVHFFQEEISGWSHWFSQNYSIISPTVLNDILSEYKTKEIHYNNMALERRDTVRGRRSAKRDRSISGDYARLQRVVTHYLNDLLNDRYWKP